MDGESGDGTGCLMAAVRTARVYRGESYPKGIDSHVCRMPRGIGALVSRMPRGIGAPSHHFKKYSQNIAETVKILAAFFEA